MDSIKIYKRVERDEGPDTTEAAAAFLRRAQIVDVQTIPLQEQGAREYDSIAFYLADGSGLVIHTEWWCGDVGWACYAFDWKEVELDEGAEDA